MVLAILLLLLGIGVGKALISSFISYLLQQVKPVGKENLFNGTFLNKVYPLVSS